MPAVCELTKSIKQKLGNSHIFSIQLTKIIMVNYKTMDKKLDISILDSIIYFIDELGFLSLKKCLQAAVA